MELSNRSIAMLCGTALLVAVILRSGAAPTVGTNAEGATPVATSNNDRAPRTPAVVNSDFGLINQQLPAEDDGVKQMKAPVVTTTDGDLVAADENLDDPLADLYPTYDSVDQSTGLRERSNNSASWANDEVLNDVGNLSEREMFDRWLSVMSDQERTDFRTVWVAMSPEERQKFLDDMRGNSNGNGSDNE